MVERSSLGDTIVELNDETLEPESENALSLPLSPSLSREESEKAGKALIWEERRALEREREGKGF